jgi:hypothetical protein
MRGEDREEAANVLAVTLHADDVISMLMAREKFKFRVAIRAVILVQWHRMLPPESVNYHNIRYHCKAWYQ